jgi:hypothetical protein
LAGDLDVDVDATGEREGENKGEDEGDLFLLFTFVGLFAGLPLPLGDLLALPGCSWE